MPRPRRPMRPWEAARTWHCGTRPRRPAQTAVSRRETATCTACQPRLPLQNRMHRNGQHSACQRFPVGIPRAKFSRWGPGRPQHWRPPAMWILAKGRGPVRGAARGAAPRDRRRRGAFVPPRTGRTCATAPVVSCRCACERALGSRPRHGYQGARSRLPSAASISSMMACAASARRGAFRMGRPTTR